MQQRLSDPDGPRFRQTTDEHETTQGVLDRSLNTQKTEAGLLGPVIHKHPVDSASVPQREGTGRLCDRHPTERSSSKNLSLPRLLSHRHQRDESRNFRRNVQGHTQFQRSLLCHRPQAVRRHSVYVVAPL